VLATTCSSDRNGLLGLPLIRNEKPVDPASPSSPRVDQLETAMGSAIALFDRAQALCVPRCRFAPVKKNNDLLVLMSDAYRLNQDYTLSLAPERQRHPALCRAWTTATTNFSRCFSNVFQPEPPPSAAARG
jgi:hypothetical protein